MAVLVTILVILGLPWIDCACRNRVIINGGQVYAEFAGLPGVIGVAFQDHSQSTEVHRLFAIREGSVGEVDFLPHKYEDAEVAALAPWPAWLKRRRPYKFDGLSIDEPSATSPDGRLLAVGARDSEEQFEYMIKHEGRLWYPLAYEAPTFMVIDLEQQRKVFLVDSEYQWGAKALAWSPDARYLAVLRFQGRQGYCLPEIVFLLGPGYGFHVIDHYLDIYDLQGQRVASRKLLSRNNVWGAEIVWTDSLQEKEVYRVDNEWLEDSAG